MDVCARILHFICLFYLPAKDVDGWKKLQERLGDNCLLIADQTLKKGLPISEQKPETILTDTPDDTNPVVLPDKPSVNYLSCGALTLEATISQTLAKATHIKGLTACMHVFTFQAWGRGPRHCVNIYHTNVCACGANPSRTHRTCVVELCPFRFGPVSIWVLPFRVVCLFITVCVLP